MSELVAFFDDKPVDLKGKLEVQQLPLAAASGLRSLGGDVRSSLVYVDRRVGTDHVLVPFGEYDDWSLRDRYNEAIRIMNTLGASTISCESYRETTSRRSLFGTVFKNGAKLTQQRDENSGFDYRHHGAGSTPRDPGPLRWPDEPGFSAAVSSVLVNGATEVNIHIKSHRRYSLGGELAAQLKKVGFSLGAGTQHTAATSLYIRAEFPGPKKLWK